MNKQIQEELLEKLDEPKHRRWAEWSKNLADKENLSEERILRREKLRGEYRALMEKEKNQDRLWARKVIKIFKELNNGGKFFSS